MQTEGRKGHKDADWLEKASEPGAGRGASRGGSLQAKRRTGEESLAVGDPEPVLNLPGREPHGVEES